MSKTRRATRTASRPAKRTASGPAKRTASALDIIDRMTGDDGRLRERIAVATLNAQIAEMLYDARRKAGLTQADLARRVGTQQPVIARLEDADYTGHSLTMLHRIAAALGRRLDVRLAPARRRPA